MELPKKYETELYDLVEVVDLENEDTYVFLTEESLSEFRDLMKEWNNADAFATHNLTVRNKLLLYGPSGNGKTSTAKFLARRAGLPMYRVRHERIIDSYVGGTGKKVAALFDCVKEIEGHFVLLFDEIDSLTMKRGEDQKENSASEEYNKALNIFLIKLEQLNPNVIFIGATNRFGAMDAAAIRRFDMLHQMPPPTAKEKIPFIERHIRHYKVELNGEVKELLELDSFSDIKRQIQYYARKKILSTIPDTK